MLKTVGSEIPLLPKEEIEDSFQPWLDKGALQKLDPVSLAGKTITGRILIVFSLTVLRSSLKFNQAMINSTGRLAALSGQTTFGGPPCELVADFNGELAYYTARLTLDRSIEYAKVACCKQNKSYASLGRCGIFHMRSDVSPATIFGKPERTLSLPITAKQWKEANGPHLCPRIWEQQSKGAV